VIGFDEFQSLRKLLSERDRAARKGLPVAADGLPLPHFNYFPMTAFFDANGAPLYAIEAVPEPWQLEYAMERFASTVKSAPEEPKTEEPAPAKTEEPEPAATTGGEPAAKPGTEEPGASEPKEAGSEEPDSGAAAPGSPAGEPKQPTPPGETEPPSEPTPGEVPE
jgi:hypothetical protein